MKKEMLEKILDELRQKVDGEQSEQPLQKFIERYPFLICGFAGHVHNNIVISQFPMGTEFKADFSYLVENSRHTVLHLIEIKSPSLKIFTANDEFSQPYNHALQQLQDWTLWCNRNQQYLSQILEPLEVSRSHFLIKCKLIAGRRSELSSKKRQRRYTARDELLPKGFEIVTWDGFLSNIPTQQFLGYDEIEIRSVTYKDQDYFEKAVEEMIYGV